MVDLDKLDRLYGGVTHNSATEHAVEAELARAYPALAAEVRALRESYALKGEAYTLLREAADEFKQRAEAAEAVLSQVDKEMAEYEGMTAAGYRYMVENVRKAMKEQMDGR